MAKMHMGIFFRQNWFCFIWARFQGVIPYFNEAFLLQGGHLYDVVSPKNEKLITDNFDSWSSRSHCLERASALDFKDAAAPRFGHGDVVFDLFIEPYFLHLMPSYPIFITFSFVGIIGWFHFMSKQEILRTLYLTRDLHREGRWVKGMWHDESQNKEISCSFMVYWQNFGRRSRSSWATLQIYYYQNKWKNGFIVFTNLHLFI